MRICVLDASTLGEDISLDALNRCGDVTLYETTKPEEVKDRVKDAEIILVNKVVLNESNLKEAEQVKMIGLLATGYNNVDTEYAQSRNIAVANVAGYSTQSVTQHTFALLLQLLGKTAQYDQYVKSKAYAASEIFTHLEWPFYEMSGKTFGIIGLGAIGKSVAKVAEAFGMQVIYYSTSGKNHCDLYESVTLEQLLKRSDVISIHAPYNKQTHHLISYEEMKQMKKAAYLLNLGRGNIVVEADLARALNEGLICGAGMDVLESEPIKHDSALYKVKNPDKLVITPHIAWASVEARVRLVELVVKNIEAFKKGEKLNRIV